MKHMSKILAVCQRTAIFNNTRTLKFKTLGLVMLDKHPASLRKPDFSTKEIHAAAQLKEKISSTDKFAIPLPLPPFPRSLMAHLQLFVNFTCVS